MIAFKKEDPVLKRSNKILTGVENRLRDHLAAGSHVPGIFILNNRMSMRQTAEELATIYGASEPDEYANIITFLPVSY